MTFPNVFTKPVADGLINRINQLTPATQPQWGKMSVSQMLAHCNVSYEMIYDNTHPKPNAFLGFILKTFVKKKVTGPAPYTQNLPTAPQFKVSNDKDFANEKQRLINYVNKTMDQGEEYFDGRASHSFGKLKIDEWNTMLYKHLDHHLRQFRV